MLTKEQVAFYQEHGYLLVERLLTQREAQELRQECHALAQRLSVHTDMDATWGSARKAVAQAKHTNILHCHNVQFYSAAFSHIIVDERLTGAAADLIGSPNVQLRHTKMRDPTGFPTQQVHKSRGQGMMLRGCRGQRARSEKFFLRMYGKLFVLTACVAQNVPSKTGRCRIPHAHSWHIHTRNRVEYCSRLIHRR